MKWRQFVLANELHKNAITGPVPSNVLALGQGTDQDGGLSWALSSPLMPHNKYSFTYDLTELMSPHPHFSSESSQADNPLFPFPPPDPRGLSDSVEYGRADS